MARAVYSSAPLSGLVPFLKTCLLAEGSCLTSRRFHEAALRVIASLSWGLLLVVIMGEAASSRSGLSSILMKWWSAA